MEFAILIVSVLFIGAIALTAVPTQEGQKPIGADEFEVPTAEPGRPIPVVHGDVILKGANSVWHGDLGYNAVKTGGGK